MNGTGPRLIISGTDPARAVAFTTPVFLAPMEGITDAVFRDLIIDLGGVGGACTEFVRVSSAVVPPKVMRRHLGDRRRDAPVAVQVMAADTTHLAESVANADRCGAAWIDLNFGCPAPVVFGKCAGSALLGRPQRMADIIRCARSATGLPVSAKLRVGIDDPSCLRDNLLAVAEAGAAMITLHARLRRHAYSHPATWAWITEAKAILSAAGHSLPLIGNGGLDHAGDAARMRAETACDGVMVGRAALANPWIFREIAGGAPADEREARDFPRRYAAAMAAIRGERAALNKLKQQVRWYAAGDLFAVRPEERTRLLRSDRYAEVVEWFAGGGAMPSGVPDAENVALT